MRKRDEQAVETPVFQNQMTNHRACHASTSSRLCSTLATKISSSVMFSMR